MNEKLLKRLGLAANADANAIAGAVSDLLDRVESLESENAELKKVPAVVENDASKMEKRIRAKIVESGGALNREQAILAIEHQDAANAKRAKAKK